MSSKMSNNNNNNNNKKLIISPQLQQMIEEANNTMQTFKEQIADIYNYALSKEKEEEDGFTSSQQVQELLRQKIICKSRMEDG
jgi:hypothetical protein